MKQVNLSFLAGLSPKQSRAATYLILLFIMARIPKTLFIQLVTNSCVLVTPLRSNMPPKHTKATDGILLQFNFYVNR